jgi:DNA-binding CsgD family transcriptional regulator
MALRLVETLAARLDRPLIVPICANGSLEFFRRCFKAGADDAYAPAPLALRPAQLPRARCLRHMVEGLTSREIAAMLALSPRTVEVHRAHLQEKLGVRNVAQLVGEYGAFAAPPP